jgi:hypothetical protein
MNHQANVYTYNVYLSISLMVTVAIRALELEYLVKILDRGRSQYIFTDFDSTQNSFRLRLRLHSPASDIRNYGNVSFAYAL